MIMPPRLGTAIVPVSPEGASVSIDGQELAPQGGLFKIPELLTDRDHVIEISHKGFVSETRRVRLNAGEVRVLPPVDLERLPTTTTLSSAAASPPRGGDAPRPAIASKPDGRKPAAQPAAKAVRHEPSASRQPSAQKQARTVRISRAASSSDDLPPPVVSGAEGVLRINSLPWSEVSIDGRLIGTTPQQRIELRPGRHKVKLVNRELGMTKIFSVQIEPGETLTKSITLVD